MSDHSEESSKFEPVFRAPNESIAEIVKGLLEAEGIPVTGESLQVPCYDGIMVTAKGYWGDLLVPSDRADEARALIEGYDSKGLPESTEEEATGTSES